MKKTTYILVIVVLLLSAGCRPGSKAGQHSSGERVLTVTIEPQRFFLEKIVGDRFTVNTLIPPGANHETYEPAPSVMTDLGKSSIYFKVGALGFENAWSERLGKNNPDVVVVNCSEGIEAIEDAHSDHAHHSHEGHTHSHSEGIDPHVWTSPSAVRIFTANMYKAVVEADPENEAFYKANFDSLTRRIDRTDSLIRDLLQDIPSRGFVIYHPALGYFARDYGLHQYSIEFEGKNPSPRQLKELVDIAHAENIHIVFIEKGYDTKNAEVMAKEIGARTYTIDPLAYDWDGELLRIARILAGKNNE